MTAFTSIRRAGPWSPQRIDQHLRQSLIPLRLASVTPGGYPSVMSLWYLLEDGHLWCAVQERARVARHCRHHPRCGFEVAAEQPPYGGVRGAGDVTIVPEEGERVLRLLLDRYLGSTETKLARWLLSRADSEVALRITPVRVFSWDYSERMRP